MRRTSGTAHSATGRRNRHTSGLALTAGALQARTAGRGRPSADGNLRPALPAPERQEAPPGGPEGRQ